MRIGKVLGAFGSLAFQGFVAFALLNGCLLLLDFPAIDSYQALHVKKLRYPSRHHVYRDEDYSHYVVNSFGLVGSEPESITRQGVYRIAVFGDSLVEAFQVAPEEKFTELIEKMVIPPQGFEKVEVWNFGYSGDNTGNAYARWLYQARAIGFHLVLFTFNDTDVLENRPEDISGQAGAFLVESSNGQMDLDESRIAGSIGMFEFTLKSWFGRFFYSTYTVKNRIMDYVTNVRTRFQGKVKSWVYVLGEKPVDDPIATLARSVVSPAKIRHTCHQLAYVRSQVAATGSHIVIIGLPSGNAVLPDEIAKDPLRHDSYIAVAECLRTTGIPLVDLYPVMATEIEEARDPYSDWDLGAHLNSLGHRLLAGTVVSTMVSDGILSRRGEKN